MESAGDIINDNTNPKTPISIASQRNWLQIFFLLSPNAIKIPISCVRFFIQNKKIRLNIMKLAAETTINSISLNCFILLKFSAILWIFPLLSIKSYLSQLMSTFSISFLTASYWSTFPTLKIAYRNNGFPSSPDGFSGKFMSVKIVFSDRYVSPDITGSNFCTAS